MQQEDSKSLVDSLGRLFEGKEDSAGIETDKGGWASLAEVCERLTVDSATPVTQSHLEAAIRSDKGKRFSLHQDRVRIRRSRHSKGNRKRSRRAPPRATACIPPDILYHATTEHYIQRLRKYRTLSMGPRRYVYLSSSESQAWQVAHRLGPHGQVLYVDSTRALRHGVKFYHNEQTGLYLSTEIPKVDILNLQSGFGEQLSAGGFPVAKFDDGEIRIALIRVSRRSGTTWEVAKGKCEPGETPESTATREVQEEMGIGCNLEVIGDLEAVRYGFMAPGGLPRLKTVFLYLLAPLGSIAAFTPAQAEGITSVRWFTIREAVQAVTHSSLQPVMASLQSQIDAVEPDCIPTFGAMT